MKFKKKDLVEIIDSNGDLIGNDNIPKNGSDLETQASNTTDYNSKIGAQPYRYDMLGRFGFGFGGGAFFEGVEDESVDNELLNELSKLMYDKYMETLEYYYRHPNKLKSDFRMHSEHDFEDQPEDRKEMDIEWAKKALKVVEPYAKKLVDALDEPKNIDEAKVVEDKVVDKRSEDEISKKSKDSDITDKKLEKIAGLISKLDQADIDKLKNLLENK
jgi:hypothetical protein